MAYVTHLEHYGNQIKIYYNDGTSAFALPTHTSVWMVTLTGGGGTTPPGNGQFSWPYSLSVVSSEFGWRPSFGRWHEGMDFSGGSAFAGANVCASNDGVIEALNMSAAYGNAVQIGHGTDTSNNGLHTIYGHLLHQPIVSVGQSVTKGQVIGYLGDTGTSQTGYNLHFETHTCPNNGPIVHDLTTNADGLQYRTAINPRDFMVTYGDGGVLVP